MATVDTVPETIILLIVSVIFGDRILAAAGFNAGDRFVSIGPAINALVALVTVAFVLFSPVKTCNEFKRQGRRNERVVRDRFTQRRPLLTAG